MGSKATLLECTLQSYKMYHTCKRASTQRTQQLGKLLESLTLSKQKFVCMISFSLRSISIHSLAFHPEKLVCFCKLIKIDFPHIFPVLLFALFRVKVESSVDIFRAFSVTCFFLFPFFSALLCVTFNPNRTNHSLQKFILQ